MIIGTDKKFVGRGPPETRVSGMGERSTYCTLITQHTLSEYRDAHSIPPFPHLISSLTPLDLKSQSSLTE